MTATPIHDELLAALRRRARDRPAGAADPGPGPDGDGAGPELDDQARRVLALARDEAVAHGRARWGTGHLLLGLLRAGGAVGSLLGAAGVTAGAMRRSVARHEALSAPGDDDTVTTSPRPCSPAAQRVLDAARSDAAAAGRSAVGPADLLAGVFAAGERGTASMVLSVLEVPGGELADAARTLAARPAPEQPAARWRDPSRLLGRRT